ncbi:MAG TPA: FIST signal transduction protein [Desulfobacterales bacterium]
MKIGIGFSNRQDATASGRQVAAQAIENAGIQNPTLVFAFCGGDLNAAEFYGGLQSVCGDGVPIVGGSAIGVITNEHLDYNGRSAAALVMASDTLRCRVAAVDGLAADEKQAGIRLARRLAIGGDAGFLLLFYDSIKQPGAADSPPILNASTALIEGLESGLPAGLPVFGAGLIGDYDFQSTVQFDGAGCGSQKAVAVHFREGVSPRFRIMHGCTPLDGIYRTVTRAEGACIYELDGRPIAPLIDALYGDRDWRCKNPVDLLTIGIYHGDKFSGIEEGRYVNRLIAGILPDGLGIAMFEPDIREGTEVQFMLRDTQKMIQSATRNAAAILKEVRREGKKALCGLYIDCAGRAAGYSKTVQEEAAEVQKAFRDHGCPLLGFYSGVEIAPLLGRSRGLDWTGVLLLFVED